MAWGYYKPYVPVAKRRAQAQSKIAKLKKKGKQISPVQTAGRKIATTFWGKAWCDHIEAFSDFDNRLPRGRTYVRNGSVCHLEINEGEINAIVSGSALYNVKITIASLSISKWKNIKRTCQGKIHSVLDLLAGKLSSGVMDIVCHQRNGLFPLSQEIQFKCNCPDWASMCKHIAATLYGVGTRLDDLPAELFKLRGVDHEEMINIHQVVSDITSTQKGRGNRLSSSEVSGIFNFDLDDIEKSQNRKKAKETVAPPKVLTGNAIIKRRKALGLSKIACAKKIKVSVSSLTKWETCGRKKVRATAPSIQKIHNLWKFSS